MQRKPIDKALFLGVPVFLLALFILNITADDHANHTTSISKRIINTNFEQVITLCQKVQRKNEDTWINDIIINTYTKLYKKKKVIV